MTSGLTAQLDWSAAGGYSRAARARRCSCALEPLVAGLALTPNSRHTAGQFVLGSSAFSTNSSRMLRRSFPSRHRRRSHAGRPRNRHLVLAPRCHLCPGTAPTAHAPSRRRCRQAGPAVFSDINITPLTDIFPGAASHLHGDPRLAGRGRAREARAVSAVDLPKGAAKELQTAARDFTVAIRKSAARGSTARSSDEQVLPPASSNSTRTRRGAGHPSSGQPGVQHGRSRGDGSGQSDRNRPALPSPTDAAGSSAQLLESAAIPRRFRDALLERNYRSGEPAGFLRASVPFAT